jgi:hypothetical protein
MHFLKSIGLRRSPILPKTHRRAFEILRRIDGRSSPLVAELGVYRGRLSAILLRSARDLRLVMIDSWEGEGAGYADRAVDPMAAIDQPGMDALYEEARRRTNFAGARRSLLRLRTDAAAARIEDASLDLCFIDADHSYEGCGGDIARYAAKVKAGAFLGGHDYARPDAPQFGVTAAVDEFVAARRASLELGLDYTWFVRM